MKRWQNLFLGVFSKIAMLFGLLVTVSWGELDMLHHQDGYSCGKIPEHDPSPTRFSLSRPGLNTANCPVHQTRVVFGFCLLKNWLGSGKDWKLHEKCRVDSGIWSGYPGFVCETGCMQNEQHRNWFCITFLMFQSIQMHGRQWERQRRLRGPIIGISWCVGIAWCIGISLMHWDHIMRQGSVNALGLHHASRWR